MSKRERRKGQDGEQEVSRAYRQLGFTVRGLEGLGDHSIVLDPETGVRIHSEVKRQETARPWAWWEQASTEAPPGTIPVVHFRRNRSPWLAMLGMDALIGLLCELRDARRAIAELRRICLDPDRSREVITRREILRTLDPGSLADLEPAPPDDGAA